MEREKTTNEVFTPRSLVREMLDRLPTSVWFDPNKTWLEPSAGDGNFLVEIKNRLLQFSPFSPNDEDWIEYEKHILNNMLFSIELIPDNHWYLQHRLGYLDNGKRGPLWDDGWFRTSKAHEVGHSFTTHNPYGNMKVYHHLNHVCWSALEYDKMSFCDSEPGSDKVGSRPEIFVDKYLITAIKKQEVKFGEKLPPWPTVWEWLAPEFQTLDIS